MLFDFLVPIIIFLGGFICAMYGLFTSSFDFGHTGLLLVILSFVMRIINKQEYGI
jgi:hypothetical protein